MITKLLIIICIVAVYGWLVCAAEARRYRKTNEALWRMIHNMESGLMKAQQELTKLKIEGDYNDHSYV